MKVSFQSALVSAFLLLAPLVSYGHASVLQTSDRSSTVSTGKTAAKSAPSNDDIAHAKEKGFVWVNLSTHVYHKSDSSLYGKTKRGKFMAEDDAKKAGFRPANESGAPKKASGETSAPKQ